MASIESTPEQREAFAAIPHEGPIVMVNLLKFKRGGGAKSYGEYSKATMKIFEEIGAKVIYSGRTLATVIGGDEWDLVALVEYPSREIFLDMIKSDAYREGVHLRSEALDDSRLYATKPNVL